MVRDDGEQGLSYGSCLGEADVGPGVEDRQSLEYSLSPPQKRGGGVALRGNPNKRVSPVDLHSESLICQEG